MSDTSTRWVIWAALAILLPIPLLYGSWGWVPSWYTSKVAYRLFSSDMAIGSAEVLLVVQLIVSLVLFYFIAGVYLRLCKNLPIKIRGSLVGVIILTTLILFYTFPVYHSPFDDFGASVTFLQLYR